MHAIHKNGGYDFINILFKERTVRYCSDSLESRCKAREDADEKPNTIRPSIGAVLDREVELRRGIDEVG